MNKSLALLIFIVWGTTFAKNCPDCEGKEKKPVDVCFVEKGYSDDFLLKISTQSTCGYWSEKFYVDGRQDVKIKMDELKGNCQTIDGIVFYGHGYKGHQRSTGLSTGSLDMWKHYSCLIKDNTEVIVSGCNIGAGCEGDMFLHDMAKNIFSSQKGSIRAPTFHASTFLPGVIPSFSLNGKSRKLSYNPSENPPEDWTQTGLTISNGGTMAEHCKSEISDLIDDVKSARESAERRRCEASIVYLGEGKLEQYQTLANGLSDNQTWDYSNIQDVIRRLEIQLEYLNECRPPTTDRRRNRPNSSSATPI